jgi:outer membrane biosynthesis protein TonB
MRFSILLLFCISTILLQAQKIDIFSDRYMPAKPYGGKEEVQLLFENALVYPKKAIENKIEGDLFINYRISNEGRLLDYQFDSNSPEVLQEAALKVFKRILWEKYPNEPESRVSIEKMKINFKIKRYHKVVKKRAHEVLAEQNNALDSNYRVYNINQVDEKPIVTNASSVNDFVYDNFKFPSIALERGISGRVSIEFIIEPYGFISNVRITEPLAGGCNDETIRLMRAIEWESGKVESKAVRTLYKYQLNFVNPGGSLKN